ncbi:MAG TPA: hypothetical protein DHW13_11450 [Lachnospiraceae bacterium]|nr:hypothetical protein [Lachnospiraceae bacterium]
MKKHFMKTLKYWMKVILLTLLETLMLSPLVYLIVMLMMEMYNVVLSRMYPGFQEFHLWAMEIKNRLGALTILWMSAVILYLFLSLVRMLRRNRWKYRIYLQTILSLILRR